jgi:hypothetical protein
MFGGRTGSLCQSTYTNVVCPKKPVEPVILVGGKSRYLGKSPRSAQESAQVEGRNRAKLGGNRGYLGKSPRSAQESAQVEGRNRARLGGNRGYLGNLLEVPSGTPSRDRGNRGYLGNLLERPSRSAQEVLKLRVSGGSFLTRFIAQFLVPSRSARNG